MKREPHQKTDLSIITAARSGLATGLATHLPTAVGIVICGTSTLAIAVAAHLALGQIPADFLTGASGVGAGAAATLKAKARRKP